MLKQSHLVFHFILIAFFLGLNTNIVSASESPQKTLALLPLKISAQKDLSYLKNGLRNMLSSRLAANTGYKIADASLVKKIFPPPDLLSSRINSRNLGKKSGQILF